MPKPATTAPVGSFVGSVRGAGGGSGGDGIASAARSEVSSEPVADGNADTDEDGNSSDIVTALGTTAVAIITTITNRDGVIDDPVRVRDDHHHGDGTGDGRIDVATGNGAEHRAGRRSRSRRRGGSRHRRDAKRGWRGAQRPPGKGGRAAP